jgi:Cu/Ag efflux protein CusF
VSTLSLPRLADRGTSQTPARASSFSSNRGRKTAGDTRIGEVFERRFGGKGPLAARLDCCHGLLGGQSLRALASLAFVFCLLAGCSQDGSGSEASAGSAKVYQIRAQIQALPIPDRASPELVVRHEAVDGWVDPTGTVVGMDAMTMPFPLESEAVAEGFGAGDLVEMTVSVDWDGPRPVLVTALEPLPSGTQLDFRAARSATGSRPDKGAAPERSSSAAEEEKP